MTMTPSAVASIARWLSFWEVTEYVSEALVALGCLGEYVADDPKAAPNPNVAIEIGSKK